MAELKAAQAAGGEVVTPAPENDNKVEEEGVEVVEPRAPKKSRRRLARPPVVAQEPSLDVTAPAKKRKKVITDSEDEGFEPTSSAPKEDQSDLRAMMGKMLEQLEELKAQKAGAPVTAPADFSAKSSYNFATTKQTLKQFHAVDLLLKGKVFFPVCFHRSIDPSIPPVERLTRASEFIRMLMSAINMTDEDRSNVEAIKVLEEEVGMLLSKAEPSLRRLVLRQIKAPEFTALKRPGFKSRAQALPHRKVRASSDDSDLSEEEEKPRKRSVRKKIVTCSYCKKDGHSKKRCYTLRNDKERKAAKDN